MDGHEWAERYENAIRRFQERLTQNDEDHTFRLDATDAESIGVDPVVFSDLKRSLEETNEKIKRGELDWKQVRFM